MTTSGLPNRMTLLAASYLLATAVQANPLLAPAHYQGGLQRCVAEIRAQMDTTEALHHTVTSVSRERQWYAFTLVSTVAAGAAQAPELSSRCRAHRFSQDTRLERLQPLNTNPPQLAGSS